MPYTLAVSRRQRGADHRMVIVSPNPPEPNGIRQVRSNNEVYAIADEFDVAHEKVMWEGGDFDHEEA